MLFSAIRAKGGFNNNPTVSQFEAAYKSIIVHSEIKSSSSANCMALDDTTILTVSSSNIKVKDTQSELLDLLCVAGTDDLENDNLLSVYQHSNFINDVVACIAGFVVRKIKNKTILCDTCAVEIEVGSLESKLLDRKNRGGLIKPSHDMSKYAKLEGTAEEIRAEHPGRRVKCIRADFADPDTSEVYGHVGRELHGLEVGVLVNNVGLSYPHPEYFLKAASSAGWGPQLFDDMIQCNITSMVNMCRLVMPGMADRKRGCASTSEAPRPASRAHC
ncbi:hypothetical protein QTP88_011149 [Uroleucon formosanum]